MAIIFNIHEAARNSAFNVFQEPIKMLFENEVEQYQKQSFLNKIYVMEKLDKFQSEYRSTTEMGGFRPTEDLEVAGLTDFEESYGKQFRTQIWTNSFAISKQTQEDENNNAVKQMSRKFIRTEGRTRERYGAKMLGIALGTETEFEGKTFNGTGFDTVDGSVEGVKRQFFHNAHKGSKVGGTSLVTQSNKFTSTLDFSGADPELEIKIMDVLGQVESVMKKYTDDKGNILDVAPNTILIGDDYRLKDALERGLRSKFGNQMGGNGVNNMYGRFELLVWPYLSEVNGFKDADKAIVLIDSRRNEEGLGAVWFDRTPLEISSNIDPRTKANVWDGRARFGVGFGDFRAMSYISLSGTQTSNATVITPLTTAIKPVVVTNTVSVQDVGPSAIVTFTAKNSVSDEAITGFTVVVKDSAGNVVDAESAGVYDLEPDAYTYTISKTGYVTQADVSAVVSKADAAIGTKSINVSLVAN